MRSHPRGTSLVEALVGLALLGVALLVVAGLGVRARAVERRAGERLTALDRVISAGEQLRLAPYESVRSFTADLGAEPELRALPEPVLAVDVQEDPDERLKHARIVLRWGEEPRAELDLDVVLGRTRPACP